MSAAAPAAADLKGTVKGVKAALDAGQPAEALALAAPLLKGEALEAQAAKEPKQRPMVYTLCAFAGLAHAQSKQPAEAEACYLRATRVDEAQFPAWKGLYDVYTQQGASSEKLRGVLEKLVPAAPAGLKKLSYSSQLIRLQLTPSSLPAATASVLSDSVSTLLSDPLLSSSAAVAPDSKDAAEVARLRLELHTSAWLCACAVERAEKGQELRVRLDRQLKKYREERERADKLRAQQAASKSGQMAAAVKVAKGGVAPPSQAEEEADIVRRVTLRLEKDFAEKSTLAELESRVLATPAPGAAAAGSCDPNHLMVHEHILARLVLQAHVAGAFTSTATAAAYHAAVASIKAKADEILRLTASAPSAYASRVLLGLTWTIGGGGSSDALLAQQAFIERTLSVLSAAEGEEREWSWMAWHALASSVLSTETLPQIAELTALAPPALQQAMQALGDTPGVFELAEAMVRHVPVSELASSSNAAAAPAAAAAVSSASSSSSAASAPAVSLLSAPSPLLPSFLSPVTLAYALQRQGEAKLKDALSTIQAALTATKSYRAVLPFDARVYRAANHAELSLAGCYASKVLDERQVEQGERIYARVIKAIKGAESEAERDTDALVRALRGLVSCALVRRPPNYAAADEHLRELLLLAPNDAYVRSMRGFLALQEARSIKAAAGARDPQAHLPRLREAAQFLQEALDLAPDSAENQLRLGQAYFEQDVPGEDQTRTDPVFAKRAFERAAELAKGALGGAGKGTAIESATKQLLANSLALQGVWAERVAGDVDAAKKQYVAALKVDPSNDVAGPALCEHLLAAPAAAASSSSSASASGSLDRRLAALHALAQAAVTANPRCVWGWVRLARSQVLLGGGSSDATAAAISSYQNALRMDGESMQASQCWRELAECYNAEGQFISAYKAMIKCVEISDAAIKAANATAAAAMTDQSLARTHELNLYLLAKCQLQLGGTAEAIRTLEGVVVAEEEGEKEAPVLPATKLLGEALYVQANVFVQTGRFHSAVEVLDRAVGVVRRATKLAGSSAPASESDSAAPLVKCVSVWKLLGDCYALYNALPVDEASFPPSAVAADDSDIDGSDSLVAAVAAAAASDLPLAEKRKLSLLHRASRAYLRAASLDPQASEYWYDAALCQWKAMLALHAPATVVPADGAAAPSMHPLESSYRSRGVSLVKAALVLSPQNSVYWQLLAVLESAQPLVAQHALIQSIACDPSKDGAAGAMGWTNLGLFYLNQSHTLSSSSSERGEDDRQSLLGVSRHALEMAQTLDPSNPALWSAQGVFNKGVGSLEAFVQARACFARSLELHPSALARFGVAYSAYCTGDLATARFAAGKFNEQFPRHAAGWNLAGLILEQEVERNRRPVEGVGVTNNAGASASSSSSNTQLAEEAVEAFARAEALLAVDAQLCSEQQRADLIRSVRINRARALASAGRLDESAQLYQSLIQDAAAQASSGAPTASVLAAAVTLHVDLALVYARQGALEQALAMQGTAVAISAQQVALAADGSDPSLDAEQAAHLRAVKNDLVLRRRVLLLQQAQLHAQRCEWDASKHCLQQSVSDSPDFPHPRHYFAVMGALYAVALQQGDVASAEYAVGMMEQCVLGLVQQGEEAGGAESGESVMGTMLPTFMRIQAQVAVMQGDLARARRLHCKLIALNPTALEPWNDLYAFILSSHSAASPTAAAPMPVSSILSTASLPPLEVVHSCRLGESAFLHRMELLALSFLAVGRVGPFAAACSSSAADVAGDDAAKKKEEAAEKRAAEEMFKQDEAEEEAEFDDDAADVSVRDKAPASGAAVLPAPLPAAEDESWPRVSNLHSGRLAAHLLHMDPTRSSAWGVQAASVYAQAVQVSCAADPASAGGATAILFSKALKLLQLYSSLLTSELTSPALAQSNPLEAAPARDVLMADLCNCQVMLVDSYLRRSVCAADPAASAADLEQASLFLASIREQQSSMGPSFPLHASLLSLLAARLSLRQGDTPAALKLYRAALEAQPLSVHVWEELSEVYANSQALPAAEACLQASMTLVKEAEQAGRMSSEACKETGTAGSSSPAAFFLLGLHQAALSHPDQAMRALQHALNLALEGRDLAAYAGAGTAAPGALLAALHSYPVGTLKLNLALLFLRTAAASSAPSGPLAEAHGLLQEELQGVSGVSAAPIYYQLALTAHQQRDAAGADAYLHSALQLRPATALYQRLQRTLERSAAGGGAAAASEVPAAWDEE